jgi:uncharacterized membrane protein YdjX (TVP38/TMEM64 family)
MSKNSPLIFLKSVSIPMMNSTQTKLKFATKLKYLSAIAIFYLYSELPALAQGVAVNKTINPQQWLQEALVQIQNLGFTGAIAFILLYMVATVAFLPGTILTLGAGVVFGVVLGSVYVFIGATFGATAAFLVGRYLARGWIAKKIEGDKRFSAIDQAVEREGFKIVLLTRLSPAFPFILLNYAYGLTSVSLRDYFLGSLGMIPGTVTYVYLGSLAGNLAKLGTETRSTNPAIEWTIRIIGLIATIAVTVYITRIARNALNTVTSDQ